MKKLAFIVFGVLFLGSNAFAQTGGSMNAKLTIVFVHGLWADGSWLSKTSRVGSMRVYRQSRLLRKYEANGRPHTKR